RAISTLAGHSLLHALQLRHSERASFRSSLEKASAPTPAKSCLNIFALPRVTSRSSRVARYDGHMVPPLAMSLRHTPAPLQASKAISKPPSLRHLKTVSTLAIL